MINVGEQLVSSYLRHIMGCDFIETNLYTQPQGEIDVIGLNQKEQRVYICEVTIHLTTGLLYVNPKNNRTNNVQKITEKFSRDIEYARTHLRQYEHHFMLWSPIVKRTKGKPENNQIQHVEEVKTNIKERYGVEVECIVNKRFDECLRELRNYAKTQTKALQCPVMRLMQIEEYLSKHLAKLD